MTPDLQAIAAQKLLDQKVRETITKCGIAGLGAVLVSNAGDRTIHSAQGTRKLGASGAAAQIQPQDRWCLGSVSKPVTGTAVGILIQKGIGSLTWTTKLKEVFPEIVTELGAWPQYQEVTLEQFMAHASGMGWNAGTEPNAGAPGGGWFPSPEALGLNDQNVIERRRRFVQASVLDEPLFAAGKGEQYGGGTIIVASMFETRTGIRFEQLVRKHVYAPLGMSESGWGVTSPGTLDGPWHHRWDGASLALLPDEATHTAPFNFNSHGVAGNLAISTADMGRFIKENLRPDPQILTLATRDSIQSHLPAPGVSTGTRGAWICTDPAHAATADLWHNGDDGTSYADAGLHRSAHWGSAAFSNVSHVMGAAAVNDLQAAMTSMMGNWNALFATSSGPFWECVHPGPRADARACWPSGIHTQAHRRHGPARRAAQRRPKGAGRVPGRCLHVRRRGSRVGGRSQAPGGGARGRQPDLARIVGRRGHVLVRLRADPVGNVHHGSRSRDLRDRGGRVRRRDRRGLAHVHDPVGLRWAMGSLEGDRGGHVHLSAGDCLLRGRSDGSRLRTRTRLSDLAQHDEHRRRELGAALAAHR